MNVGTRRWALCCLLGVLGCDDGPLWQGPPVAAPDAAVIFVSPHDGQRDVPASEQVHARFSQPVADAKLGLSLEGTPVAVASSPVEDGRGAVLQPTEPLRPGATYSLTYAGAPVSRFTVSPSAMARGANGFRVRGVSPLGESPTEVWPFSTFHVLLSEPVDEATVNERSVRLINVESGAPVLAALLPRGRTIAVDPEGDLVAGMRYRLELTPELKDLTGEPLQLHTRELTVASVSLTQTMELGIGPGEPASILDGRPSNTLSLRSKLVGTQTLSVAGSLRAQLPDLASAGARIPLVVRRGQVLSMTVSDPKGLAISLYGQVPTGLHSGPLRLVLLTDSTGEILQNPHVSGRAEGPPVVRMTLDASLLAGDATVHTLLTQDLLHLQLSGLLAVEEGQLVVDLIGTAELELLGMETAPSSVTLRARSRDASAPEPAAPLRVISAAPAPISTDVSPDAVMRIVLDAPPDPVTAGGYLWLEPADGDGQPVGSSRVDLQACKLEYSIVSPK